MKNNLSPDTVLNDLKGIGAPSQDSLQRVCFMSFAMHIVTIFTLKKKLGAQKARG